MTEDDRTRRLAEIRERLAASTPGPWKAIPCDDNPADARHPDASDRCEVRCNGITAGNEWDRIVTTDSGVYDPCMHDAALIAHAPEDLAWLLDLLEAVERDHVIAEMAEKLLHERDMALVRIGVLESALRFYAEIYSADDGKRARAALKGAAE